MLSPLLLVLGIACLLVAWRRALPLGRRFLESDPRLGGAWRRILALLGLFTVGYPWILWIVLSGHDGHLPWAVSAALACGALWVLWVVSWIHDALARPSGSAHLGTDATLTELEAARREAEAASQAKSSHLAQMSHELRTPLNSVVGFTNLLRKNKWGNLGPKELLYLDRILENGGRLLSLVNDILDLSKIEAGEMELRPEDVDLEPLLTELMGQLSAQLEDRPVQMVLQVPPDTAPLHTDRGKLSQVLINLLGNAMKFTEEGTIRVRILVTQEDRRPAQIDVIDSGIGISKDKLESIFEAFQQDEAGRKYGGTGLGLSISRSLCQWLGYRLSATSEGSRSEGGSGGSTFSIQLIENPPELAKPQRRRDSKEMRPFNTQEINQRMRDELVGGSILVVNDENGLSQRARQFGLTVLASVEDDEALQTIERLAPDAVVLDRADSPAGQAFLATLVRHPELSELPVLVVVQRPMELDGPWAQIQSPVGTAHFLAHLWRLLDPGGAPGGSEVR